MWKVWLNQRHITLQLSSECTMHLLSRLPEQLIICTLKNRHPGNSFANYYPKTISNSTLHKKTHSQPIQIEISRSRPKIFEHILHSDISTPANQMMMQFLTNPEGKTKYKGRQPLILPVTLHRELMLAQFPL